MRNIRIGDRYLGDGEPVYIIAEIGSNFDGNLEQAKKLIDLAREAGADAAKFQSFSPDKILARKGFKTRVSFQAKWDKPVYEVYAEAMLPREWHRELAVYCRGKGIDFLSAPYDTEAADLLDDIGVPAFKIGSGEITNISFLEYVAGKGSPIILGTGASTLGEVEAAVNAIRGAGNENIVLLQCVTAYPSPIEQANIRAMVAMGEAFGVPVGYSDHTPGSVVPLGAVALGACVIEKHFTFDKSRLGPDHPFAMDVAETVAMIRDIRLLELALGSPVKQVAPAEKETVVIQRRGLFASVDIPAGTIITEAILESLRPAIGIPLACRELVVGRQARADIQEGEPVTWQAI